MVQSTSLPIPPIDPTRFRDDVTACLRELDWSGGWRHPDDLQSAFEGYLLALYFNPVDPAWSEGTVRFNHADSVYIGAASARFGALLAAWRHANRDCLKAYRHYLLGLEPWLLEAAARIEWTTCVQMFARHAISVGLTTRISPLLAR